MKSSTKKEKESDEQTAQLENLSRQIPDSVIYRAYIDKDGVPQLNFLSNTIDKFIIDQGLSLADSRERFFKMIHEEDREYYLNERNKAQQAVTDLNVDIRFKTNDGEIIWVNNRAKPKQQANGSFVWEGFLIDITGRKKAEEELKISEERFRSYVENSNAVFYSMTLDGTFTFITDNCKELFGHDRNNVIGVSAFDGFVHHHDVAMCKAYIEKLIATGERQSAIEYRVWHGDGYWIWISTSVSPVVDKDGVVRSFQGIALEITERKKAEEALIKSEERFRSFVENANDTVFTISPEGTLLYASPNWTNVLGHDVNDFIGKSVFESLIHPDDIPACIEAIIRGVVTGEKQSGIEYRTSHKDGSWRWQTTNASPFFDKKGKVISFLGIARDITEQKAAAEALKKSESLFRSLVENANDIIYTLSLDGILTYASPNASKLLGHDVNTYLGQSVYETFLHPDDVEPCRLFMEAVFTTGKTQSGIEHRIRCGENSWRIFFTNASPLFDEHKNIVAFLGIARDITEQKHAAAALVESEESYHGLFNTVTEAIYIQDKNGYFIDVNTGVEKMYGYTKEELLGKTPADLAAPGKNDMQRINELMNETYSTGQSQQIDFWGQRKNGEIFPKEVICNKGKYMGNDVIITTARDISERKKAEAQIKESNERWQFALEGAGDGIWDLNTSTNKSFYSHNWKAMLGYADDEIADSIEEWEKRIHPDDRDFVTEQVKKYQQNLIPAYKCEYRMLCKDGSYKWILGRGKVVAGDAPGKPLRFIGVHTDITERKLAENQIRESKEKFSKIFHLAPDLIFLTRLSDGVVVDVNSRAFQVSGYHRSELIGKTSLDIGAWPDMKMRDQFISTLMEKGRVINYEKTLTNKSGDIRHACLSAEIIDIKGEKYSITFIEDITDRKRAEAALKESNDILNETGQLAKVGGWLYNVTDDSTTWGKETYKILEVAEGTTVTLKKSLEFYHPDDYEKINELVNRAISHGESFSGEFRKITAKGNHILVNINCKPILENGKVIKLMGAIQDITEKRQTEKELALQQLHNQQLITELTIQEHEYERQNLSSELNDDINQVLATVKMQLEMVKAAPGNKEALLTESYEQLNEAIKKLTVLTNSIDTPSMIQFGFLRSVELLTDQINLRGELQITLVNEATDLHKLDRLRNLVLYRIIQEKLNNVLQHAQATTVTIHIQSNGKEILLSITDNGVGFDMRQSKPGSSLQKIQSRVEYYNGKMHIDSAVGKGCTLYISIPVQWEAQ